MLLMTIIKAFVVVVAIILSSFFSLNADSDFRAINGDQDVLKMAERIDSRHSFYVSSPQSVTESDMECIHYLMVTWNLTGYFSLAEIRQISSYEVFIAPKNKLSDMSAWRTILPSFPVIIEKFPTETENKFESQDNTGDGEPKTYFLFRDKLVFYPWSDTSLSVLEPPLVVVVSIRLNASDGDDDDDAPTSNRILGFSEPFTFPDCFANPDMLQ